MMSGKQRGRLSSRTLSEGHEMDYLIIKEASFRLRIGVSKKERSKKQPILVDCRMSIDARIAAKSGNLLDTVDYVCVCDEIRKIAEGREWVLLETLAEELAGHIMRSHGAEEITICVKKPQALKGRAAYGAIEVRRNRHG